jgi:hypothetical protein
MISCVEMRGDARGVICLLQSVFLRKKEKWGREEGQVIY